MAIVVMLSCACLSAGPAAASNHEGVAAAASELGDLDWVWPAQNSRVTRPFVQPAHAYGSGHRGIDLDLLGEATVFAPADGVIAFTGVVAGRAVITIEHDDDLVTTLEPVTSALTPGTAVQRGEEVGMLSVGGHSSAGSLHFGVRLRGEYINPLLLVGEITRAVLLPCCE